MDDERGLTREPQPVLSLEAQHAIRNYLLRYLGPSGIILVLVSGLLGFFIRDIAMQRATHEAYAAVQKTTMEMAQKTIEAKTRADMAVKDVETVQETAKSKADNVDKQMQTLEEKARSLSSTMADLEIKAREHAEVLASSPEHLGKIASCLAEDQRMVKMVHDYISSHDGDFQKIDSALQVIQGMKALQVQCKNGAIKAINKQAKFTFNFAVKEFWIAFDGSLQSNLHLVEKIEGDTVTLTLRERDGVSVTWGVDEGVACRVCAAGF